MRVYEKIGNKRDDMMDKKKLMLNNEGKNCKRDVTLGSKKSVQKQIKFTEA